MTEVIKTFKAPIFPGNYIRHVRSMDVCFRVLTVGQLEYGATEVYVFGMWYNQGFEKSWSINITQGIYIKMADLKDWEICIDDDMNACLRKCPVVEEYEARKTTPITETEMMGLSAQLSAGFQLQVDPNLAPDEWHLIFPDYRDLSSGRATKTPWGGGSNMTSTFVVGKTDALKYKIKDLEEEVAELKTKIAILEEQLQYGDGE